MKSGKPVRLRAQARSDVEEAIDHYLTEASEKVALAYIDALEAAYAHIARAPAAGSPRYAHALGLPELRFHPLKRYPFLVFYLERADHIDVWRVLHEKRDIPAWMNEQ